MSRGWQLRPHASGFAPNPGRVRAPKHRELRTSTRGGRRRGFLLSTDLHLTKALLATALHIRVRAQRQAAVRALDVLLCAQASPIAEIGSIAPGIDRLYCTTCSSAAVRGAAQLGHVATKPLSIGWTCLPVWPWPAAPALGGVGSPARRQRASLAAARGRGTWVRTMIRPSSRVCFVFVCGSCHGSRYVMVLLLLLASRRQVPPPPPPPPPPEPRTPNPGAAPLFPGAAPRLLRVEIVGF